MTATLIIIMTAILLTIVGVRTVLRAFKRSLQAIHDGELSLVRQRADRLQDELDAALRSNQLLVRDNVTLGGPPADQAVPSPAKLPTKAKKGDNNPNG